MADGSNPHDTGPGHPAQGAQGTEPFGTMAESDQPSESQQFSTRSAASWDVPPATPHPPNAAAIANANALLDRFCADMDGRIASGDLPPRPDCDESAGHSRLRFAGRFAAPSGTGPSSPNSTPSASGAPASEQGEQQSSESTGVGSSGGQLRMSAADAATAAAARERGDAQSRRNGRSSWRSRAQVTGDMVRELRAQVASVAAAESRALRSQRRELQRERQVPPDARAQTSPPVAQQGTARFSLAAALQAQLAQRIPSPAAPATPDEPPPPPLPVQFQMQGDAPMWDTAGGTSAVADELNAYMQSAATGAAPRQPTAATRAAPEDAAIWKERAQALNELCSPFPGLENADNLDQIKNLVAFLADVADAEPSSSWDSSSLLKDMGEMLGETLHLRLLGPANTHPEILLEASRLYWYLTRSDANKPQMLQTPYLESAIASLARCMTLPDVQFNLVVGFSNLALGIPGTKAVFNASVLQRVTAACRAHETHMELQLAACILMGHMMIHDWSAEETTDNTPTPQVNGKNIAKKLGSTGCYMAIKRIMTATPLKHPLLLSALKSTQAVLKDDLAHLRHFLLVHGFLPIALSCFRRFFAKRDAHPISWKVFGEVVCHIFESSSIQFRASVLALPDALEELCSCLELSDGAFLQPHLLEGLYETLNSVGQDAAVKVLPRVKFVEPLLQLLRPDLSTEGVGGACSQRSQAAILQRILQLAFNAKQRNVLASTEHVQLISEQLHAFGDVPCIAEPLMGIVWLLCFVDRVKSDVKDDKHNILTRLQLIHADMPSNGAVQERFAAIRAMCKLGGGGGAGYGW